MTHPVHREVEMVHLRNRWRNTIPQLQLLYLLTYHLLQVRDALAAHVGIRLAQGTRA